MILVIYPTKSSSVFRRLFPVAQYGIWNFLFWRFPLGIWNFRFWIFLEFGISDLEFLFGLWNFLGCFQRRVNCLRCSDGGVPCRQHTYNQYRTDHK